MAKVKELIKNSVFMAAPGFEKLNPDVTVVMPTFRRGDNGLFKKSVESILAQTFKNFELIIIDDASVDSTFSQIKHFMEIDCRVSVIRHEKNIGLPAISEFEAFLKARSDRFFYAFDDNEFHKDAIHELFTYLNNNPNMYAVHGLVEVETFGIFGNDLYKMHDLHARNYIPNPCLMIDRKILNNVGLYDPHVILISMCDWDLWIRVSREYQIGVVNKILCLEKGVTQNDSLGNAYRQNIAIACEYMDTNRNSQLLPENMLEYEVDTVPNSLTCYSQKVICAALEKTFKNKHWYKKPIATIDDKPYIVFLCSNYYEYSTIRCKYKIVFLEYEKMLYKDVHQMLSNASLIFTDKNYIDNSNCNHIVELKNILHTIFENCYAFESLQHMLDLVDKSSPPKIPNINYQMLYFIKKYSPLKFIRRTIKHYIMPKKERFLPFTIKNLISFLRIKILLFIKSTQRRKNFL